MNPTGFGPASREEEQSAAFSSKESGAQRLKDRISRNRVWLVIAAVCVLAASVVLLASAGGRSSDALGADNPAPQGAMAAAELLKSHGVNVSATATLAATVQSVRDKAAGTSTVVLYDPNGILDPRQVAQLVSAGALLVLVQPEPGHLAELQSGIVPAGIGPQGPSTAPADCASPAARAAGESETGSGTDAGRLFRGPVMCFTHAGAGSYAASADDRIRVLGNAAVLSNDRLDKSGNAALVLNVLGSRPQLFWYLPTVADLPTGSGAPDLAALTPAWVTPAAAWLLATGFLAMLWQGRRDGPLVAEPLPVAVKASETAAGRARLYQDSHSVDRAAASHRAATLTRLRRHFRLGSEATPADVAAAVPTGNRSAAEISALLVHYRPANDRDLLRWAQELGQLEKEALKQ